MVLIYITLKLGYNFSSCCYSVFSIDVLVLSPWRAYYIIQLPLDDLGPLFVDRLGHYMSACPIRHLPKPLMSCGIQGSTVQGSSSYKCNQKIWQDALNVEAATIPSIMSGLTPFPYLFLNGRTSSGNVPLTGSYRPRV